MNARRRKRAKRRGFTLLEVALATAVGAVVASAAAWLVGRSGEASRNDLARKQLVVTVEAIHNLYTGYWSYGGLSQDDLVRSGAFPRPLYALPGDGTVLNPWGGSVGVSVDPASPRTFSLSSYSVPPLACAKLGSDGKRLGSDLVGIVINGSSVVFPATPSDTAALCRHEQNLMVFSYR